MTKSSFSYSTYIFILHIAWKCSEVPRQVLLLIYSSAYVFTQYLLPNLSVFFSGLQRKKLYLHLPESLPKLFSLQSASETDSHQIWKVVEKKSLYSSSSCQEPQGCRAEVKFTETSCELARIIHFGAAGSWHQCSSYPDLCSLSSSNSAYVSNFCINILSLWNS